VPAQSNFPWKVAAIALGVLVAIFLLRWIIGVVWWLAGALLFAVVVGAIVWAVFMVTKRR
jgi:hypothetical protein